LQRSGVTLAALANLRNYERPSWEQDPRRREREALLVAVREALRFQLGRPDGCLCLGLEGRRQATQFSTTGYCPCPEGEAAWRQWMAREQAARWAMAHVPIHFQACRLETYPATAATTAVVRAVRHWAGTSESPGVYLCGPVGTGKTGLAVGLLWHEMFEFAIDGQFLNLPAILAARRAEFDQHGAARAAAEQWEAAKTAPALVVDDLGANRESEWALEQVYELVNARYSGEGLGPLDNDYVTIFTSNFTLDELGERLGERIASRLHGMCDVIEVDGPDLRRRKRTAQMPDVLDAARAVVDGVA
jgi:DNA replication protein DnaC